MTQLNISAADERNGTALERELEWLSRVLAARLASFFEQPQAGDVDGIVPPELDDSSAYGAAVAAVGLDRAERLVAILALSPWVKPEVLDLLFIRNQQLDRMFTVFGATPSDGRPGFRPTRETALFLLAGGALPARLAAMRLFAPQAALQARRVIVTNSNTLAPWGPLEPHTEWLEAVLRR